jgi:TP901 family phage tail tape measure protein
MPDYQSKYVFTFELHGDKALQEAKRLQAALEKSLKGSSDDAAAKALERQNAAYAKLLQTTADMAQSITRLQGRTEQLTKALRDQAARGWQAVESRATSAGQAMQKAGQQGEKSLEQLMAPTQAAGRLVEGNLTLFPSQATDHGLIQDALYLSRERAYARDQQIQRTRNTVQGNLVDVLRQVEEQKKKEARQAELLEWRLVQGAYRTELNINKEYEPDRRHALNAQIASRFEAPQYAGVGLTPRQWLGEYVAGLQEGGKKYADFRRQGYEMQGMGRQWLFASTAAAGGIALMSNEYLEFNEVATRAGMAMELQIGQLDALQDAVLETSQQMGVFDPDQLAEGVRLWAAGTGESVQTSEQMNRVLQDTVSIQKLAAMNSVDFGTAVENVGGAMHEFGMNVNDVNEIAAVFNYVSAKTFANVDDIGEAFKMVGPVAHSMGISFTEAASALALLSDQNIKGTMAGRAFRQMLIQLNKPSKEYNATMNEMLGFSEEQGEAWRKEIFPQGEFVGMAGFIGTLAENLGQYNQEEQNRRLAVLATANALPALTSLVQQQIEVQDEGINVLSVFEKTMTGMVDSEVLAYQRWYEATTGLPYSLEGAIAKFTNQWETYEAQDSVRAARMKQRWEAAIIGLGEAFTSDLLPAVEGVSGALIGLLNLFEEHPWLRSVVTTGVIGGGLGGAGLLGAGQLVQVGANIAIINTALKQAGGLGALLTSMGTFGALLKIAGGAALVGGAGLLAGGAGALLISGAQGAATADTRQAQEAELADVDAAVQKRFNELFRRELFGGNAFIPRNEEARQIVLQVNQREADYAKQGSFLSYGLENEGQVRRALILLERELIAAAEEAAAWAWRLQMSVPGADMPTSRAKQIQDGTYVRFPTPAYTPLDDSQLEIAQAYDDYLQERDDVIAQYDDRAEDAQESFDDWKVKSSRDLGRQLADLERSEGRDTEQRREEQQDRLAKLDADFYRQQEEAAEKHHLNLRRMREDHNDRLVDLLEAGDVRGITKEMGRYKKERQRAIEDYDLQQRDRQEEYSRQRQEAEASFEEEEAQRKEANDRRRQEMLEDYALQLADRQEALDEQLAELEEAKGKELTALEKAQEELQAQLHGVEAIENAHFKLRYKQAETFWNDMEALQNEKMLALIQQYEEFYLGKAGFEAAADDLLWSERDMGEPSNPYTPQGGLFGGRSNEGVVLYMQNDFTGVSVEDRAWIEQMIDVRVPSILEQAVRQAKHAGRGTY